MNIGLIDVDGHNFPNLALMKISRYEKMSGNNVEWCIPMKKYDRVYIAKVFTFTHDFNSVLFADEIIHGGTGYDIGKKLPANIERMYPDYSLYNIKNTAYGFLTRGCPRGCNFCIVSGKEGKRSYKVNDLKNFWDGQKEIKLLDPNLLACPDHIELLDQLIESNAYIDFTQGIDCRLLTEKNIERLLKCKIKMIHFAWDKKEDEKIILEKLEIFNTASNLGYRNKRVYILTNFDTTFEYDLYRIEKLVGMNYDPFVMIYNKEKSEKKYRHLQRYVNNKFVFRSCKINEYQRGVIFA
ncbi:MAG: radical SAM protein [Syntrophothermus sp.]